MQEQHVGGIQHRDICGPVVCLPSRPRVEIVQRLRPLLHVCEAAEPDEPVWIVEVAEGPYNVSTHFILSFDEFTLKHRDQIVPSTAIQRVLAQLHDGPTASGSIVVGGRRLNESETRCCGRCETSG